MMEIKENTVTADSDLTSHKICEHCYGRLASLLPVKPAKVPARVKCPQVGSSVCTVLCKYLKTFITTLYLFSSQGDCDYTSPPFRNLEIEEMIRNYELEVNTSI